MYIFPSVIVQWTMFPVKQGFIHGISLNCPISNRQRKVSKYNEMRKPKKKGYTHGRTTLTWCQYLIVERYYPFHCGASPICWILWTVHSSWVSFLDMVLFKCQALERDNYASKSVRELMGNNASVLNWSSDPIRVFAVRFNLMRLLMQILKLYWLNQNQKK